MSREVTTHLIAKTALRDWDRNHLACYFNPQHKGRAAIVNVPKSVIQQALKDYAVVILRPATT